MESRSETLSMTARENDELNSLKLLIGDVLKKNGVLGKLKVIYFKPPNPFPH